MRLRGPHRPAPLPPRQGGPIPRPTLRTSRRPASIRLGARIAELAAGIAAASGELLALIREFDARNGWTGFASCAQRLATFERVQRRARSRR